MALATINLKLDEEAAQIFASASKEKKEKLYNWSTRIYKLFHGILDNKT